MMPISEAPGAPAPADDLLRVTIDAAPEIPLEKPWRIASQVWVAFFGGVAAVTAIAFLNAGRLRLPTARRMLILGIGLAGCAGVLLLLAQTTQAPDFMGFLQNTRQHRLYSRLIAIGAFFAFYRVQTRADAQYQVFGRGEYESLWKPGLIAVLGAGTLQGLGLAWIAWTIR